MPDIEKYLIPTESPVVLTRRHWASLIKQFGVGVVVMVIGLVVLVLDGQTQAASWFGVLLVLGAAGWICWAAGQWYLEQFIITDRRVLLVSGILTQRVAIMPLSKVTDLTYERTLGGRLLGYGTFVIESAGQQQGLSRIEYLPTPDRLYHDVSVLLFRDRYEPRTRRFDQLTTRYPDDL